MTDFTERLSKLHRPKLLVRAARFGLSDYSRNRDLKRLLRQTPVPSPAQALERLMAEEAVLEATRISGDACYSAARHVDVLIAVLSEARLLPTCPKPV